MQFPIISVIVFTPVITGILLFMIPGDPHSNNSKVFVVHSATKRVKIQVKPTNVTY